MKGYGVAPVLVALLALPAVPARAMTTDPSSIIALVRATKALAIDATVTSAGWNLRTHPYVKLNGEQGQPGGFIDADRASIGLMEGGMQVMAVPLESGGSGGVFTQIVFAQGIDDRQPYYVGAIESGGHLNVNVTFHGVVAIYPDYGPNDPNCCPSKYAIETYVVAAHRLKLLSRHTVIKP
jgi:hypothetical protein